jgi:hypothetical protein
MTLEQIKKRRKRVHALDPCLGFYPSSPSPPSPKPQIFTEQPSANTGRSVFPIVTPSLVPTCDFTHTSSEVEDDGPDDDIVKVVTVEEFLRKSAEKKPTKSYRRRKRRVTSFMSDPEGISALSSVECRPYGFACFGFPEKFMSPPSQPVSSSDVRSMIIKKTHPSRIKKAKLTQRLIRAAVLAHANPTERLRRRCDSKVDASSRRAFPFVDEPHAMVKMNSKNRTATLVNPYKIATFHEPSFPHESLSSSPIRATLKQEPITKWKSACVEFSGLHTSRAIERKTSPVHHKTSTRVPLVLIPLKDAEIAYASRSTSARSDFFIPSRCFVNVTHFRRGFSGKLHLTPVEYPPKSRHTPTSQPRMHEITHGDQTLNQPFKRVKFSSPVSSPFTNQLSLNMKSRVPSSGPVTPSIRNRASNSPHDIASNLAVQATHCGTLPAHRHGSLSDFSTAPDARTFDLSDNSKSRPGPGKPLKALASFLDGFLVMARNATQIQVEAFSRNSVKRKRTKSICPTNTNMTSLSFSTYGTARGDGDSRPPHPQSSRSMRSFMQTSSRKPGPLTAKVACQPLSPNEPVLLRTLTARSRLLLNSDRSSTSISPSVASMPSRPRSHSHTAAYDQLHGGQVTESQPAPYNPALSPLRRSLPQSFVPNSRPLVSSKLSPQQILAALQPPKAQVVLSSTSVFSEGPRIFPAICTNDSNEHPGTETPDKQGIASRSLVCRCLILHPSS